MTPFLRRVLVVVCLVFGVAHAAALPPAPEDLDSVNFALGVESFDVRAHRPHPPGYPIFIVMAKATTAAVRVVAPSWSRNRQASVGIAIWSVAAGACAALVFAAFWLAVGLPVTAAVIAAMVTVIAPLFWFTAARPLTDTVGLVVAVVVQTGLIRGLRHYHQHPEGAVPTAWWWAALIAGLLIGVRTQTMWLTGPLLCWCAGELAGRGRWRQGILLLLVAAVGVLCWLAPLVFVTGGPREYLAMLGAQGSDDFRGVQMLATDPSWPLFRTAMARTFMVPWGATALGWTVNGLAAIGLVRLMSTRPRIGALVLLASWPYLVFHLTFQETETIRYALPILVPVVGLAVIALQALGSRALIAGGAVLVIGGLWVGQPVLAAYGASGAPIFRTFEDLESRVAQPLPGAPPTTLAMHRRVASEARQAIVWARSAWPFETLPSEVRSEVHAVVLHFLRGATAPVWFLANPIRRDLDAIDPRARLEKVAYRWDPKILPLIAFARPADLDAWVITPPRWMLGRGWALTPEMGGVTDLLRLGPHRRASEAYLRRDPAPLRIVVGGRHLGDIGTPPMVITIAIDGAVVATASAVAETRFFRQWIELPRGIPAGDGAYATLSVTATSAVPGLPTPAVGLEFFDAGTEDDVLWTQVAGWQEPELDPTTGQGWRWMSGHAELFVVSPAHDVIVTVHGESSLRYFDTASELVVRAGTTEVGRVRVGEDFTHTFRITTTQLAASGGRVFLDASQSMVPAQRGVSADQRELALRIYEFSILPAR